MSARWGSEGFSLRVPTAQSSRRGLDDAARFRGLCVCFHSSLVSCLCLLPRGSTSLPALSAAEGSVVTCHFFSWQHLRIDIAGQRRPTAVLRHEMPDETDIEFAANDTCNSTCVVKAKGLDLPICLWQENDVSAVLEQST